MAARVIRNEINSVRAEFSISLRDESGTKYPDLKQHTIRLICDMYAKNNRIDCIRFIREEYELGLKDAKDLCDAYYAFYREDKMDNNGIFK